MDRGPIRVLATAFAPVPGSSPHAAAMLGLASALHGELDLVTVKTETLSHMENLGGARMFRVPVGLGTAAQQREAFGRAVARQLESQAYDAVHVRGPIEGAVVADRRRALGFRFVYEVATFPDEGESVDAETRWETAHDKCAEEADLILVPTDAGARALSEAGHAGKVAVVAPGVDVNTFDWWPAASDATVRLLYLGNFDADRDLGTLIEATRLIAKRQPIEVLLAGDPDVDRRARVRRVVDAFSLREIVRVRGEPRADALPMIIGAADICVATAAASPRFQDRGDLPQPLLEYLACRRPVVAAGVPGLAEVVRDDKEALLYPPGDEKVLAESIELLMKTPLLRERLVEAGYDRVRWQYGEGARRRRIAEVYEMLFAGSQLFDPWDEGFTEIETGLVQVPSDVFGEDGEDDDDPPLTSPPESPDDLFLRFEHEGEESLDGADTGQVLYRPTHSDRPSPDTNPSVPSAEIEVEKTRISPPPAPRRPEFADRSDTAAEGKSFLVKLREREEANEETNRRRAAPKAPEDDTNEVGLPPGTPSTSTRPPTK